MPGSLPWLPCSCCFSSVAEPRKGDQQQNRQSLTRPAVVNVAEKDREQSGARAKVCLPDMRMFQVCSESRVPKAFLQPKPKPKAQILHPQTTKTPKPHV